MWSWSFSDKIQYLVLSHFRLQTRVDFVLFLTTINTTSTKSEKVVKSFTKQWGITKTCLFKYIENFTTRNENFQIRKNSNIFHISAQYIDCGYWGGSNEYPQCMLLSKNKKNNVYPCKPQLFYIKVGFMGVKIIEACLRDEFQYNMRFRDSSALEIHRNNKQIEKKSLSF